MPRIRDRVQLFFTEPSLTKQSFKKECDINEIMKKFKKVSGVDYLTNYNQLVGGSFSDVSNLVDYRTALEQVDRAESIFMALPAKVRAEFQNDAASFLDFVNNPANASKLVDLGLTKSDSVEVVNTTGAETK